mgnify:CR=1 FL=1
MLQRWLVVIIGLPLLLARRLGQVLGIPVETPLSVRPGTRPQKELTRDERLQNARGAFVCHPGADLTGKRVLLVDDIITTGATASACALALLQAGATDVTVAEPAGCRAAGGQAFQLHGQKSGRKRNETVCAHLRAARGWDFLCPPDFWANFMGVPSCQAHKYFV